MSNMFYVVCIVVAALAADSYNRHLKMQQKKKESDGDSELAESLKKIDMLEERIRVLERIVTESKRDLSEEIDRL